MYDFFALKGIGGTDFEIIGAVKLSEYAASRGETIIRNVEFLSRQPFKVEGEIDYLLLSSNGKISRVGSAKANLDDVDTSFGKAKRVLKFINSDPSSSNYIVTINRGTDIPVSTFRNIYLSDTNIDNLEMVGVVMKQKSSPTTTPLPFNTYIEANITKDQLQVEMAKWCHKK